MALSSLHEMMKNLCTYIKSLEELCESGFTLATNFERLLSPGPGCGTSSGTTMDSDMLTQSVATWNLAKKITIADTNGFISDLLPLLKDTIESAMTDPSTAINNANTYEVFRSCFSAFFQIQWRFCQLYITCTSSAHNLFLRSPDTHMARSPTMGSFSSSGSDRRESTESCMSGFSLPRSSFSGVSSFSSRSSSPGPGLHLHPLGGRSRTSSLFESSPSVKFSSPSQPPSPHGMPHMPYGEGGSHLYHPHLFRRWSAHTHLYGQSSQVSAVGGHSAGTNYSSVGGYGSGSSLGGSSGGAAAGSSSSGSGPTTGPSGFGVASSFPYYSRRWSVPASVNQPPGSTTDSGRRTEPSDIDYGLLDAINLLSIKSSSPSNLRDIPLEECRGEYDVGDEDDEPQTTSLWPPSETMPGVVLTTCGSDEIAACASALESLQQCIVVGGPHQSPSQLQVPYRLPSPPSGPQSPVESSSQSQQQVRLGPIGSTINSGQSASGEYSLFGNNPTRN